MNVIARVEYELAYYDSVVHRFNHYTTRTPPRCFELPLRSINQSIIDWLSYGGKRSQSVLIFAEGQMDSRLSQGYQCWIGTEAVWLRIWTLVTDSIFNDNNCYTATMACLMLPLLRECLIWGSELSWDRHLSIPVCFCWKWNISLSDDLYFLVDWFHSLNLWVGIVTTSNNT